MSFANIIGELLQQGMASQSRARVEQATGPAGLGGLGNLGGLEQILGAMLGGAQGGGAARSGSSGGGLGGALGGNLGGALGGLGGLLDALGGGAKGGGGGLGSLAGVLLGGGRSSGRAGSGAGGSAMALLATLALSALQSWQQSQQAGASRFAASPEEVATLTSADTERLVLRAMISAAKADGRIDDTEISRIVDRIDDDGISEEEKRFVQAELQRPLDLGALIAEVPDIRVGAQLYAASLLAIDIDTAAERDYLRALARGLGLDAGTVARLHQMTGAPALG